jgi:hypothetical protein
VGREPRPESEHTAVALAPDPVEHPSDPEVAAVLAWLISQRDVEARFQQVVRTALDEVIDGGRTGRWAVSQLAKTEKTYIGTKIEILVRDEFDLPAGPPLDTVIAGHPVDIKWSGTFGGFEIARENVGQICLVVAGSEEKGLFQVGVVRPTDETLGAQNRDRKRKLTREGRERIRWAVPAGELPPNFLATLDAEDRDAIMSAPKGQARVRELFSRLRGRPVPRLTVETVAQQRDPMRRTRRDRAARLGEVRVLSGRFEAARRIAAVLGVDNLGSDELVAFEVRAVEEAERRLALQDGPDATGRRSQGPS